MYWYLQLSLCWKDFEVTDKEIVIKIFFIIKQNLAN